MKETTILISVKEPDVFHDLAADLDLSDEMRRRHFEFGEYATLEIQVDEELRIVGGRFVPVGKRR